MYDIAIIINTCNRPFLLRNLVQQVKEQKREGDEIIIVNDGDRDSLPDLKDVTIVQHCKDYYALASGRNAGLEKALDLGYEWGTILDDDVEVEEGWLEEHRKRLGDKNKIYAGKVTVGQSDKDKREDWWGKEVLNNKGDLVVKWGGINTSFYIPNLMDAGGFDEKFDGAWGCEDNELYHRLVENYGWDVEYIESSVVTNLQAPPAGDYRRNNSENLEKLDFDMTK